MKHTEESLSLRGMVIQQSPIETFTFNGEMYYGDARRLIDQYAITKPSKKFRIWLIDRGLRAETGTNIFKINTKMYEALKESEIFIKHFHDGGPTHKMINSLLKEIDNERS